MPAEKFPDHPEYKRGQIPQKLPPDKQIPARTKSPEVAEAAAGKRVPKRRMTPPPAKATARERGQSPPPPRPLGLPPRFTVEVSAK